MSVYILHMRKNSLYIPLSLAITLIAALGFPELFANKGLQTQYATWVQSKESSLVIEITNPHTNQKKVRLDLYNPHGISTESLDIFVKPLQQEHIPLSVFKSAASYTSGIIGMTSDSDEIKGSIQSYTRNDKIEELNTNNTFRKISAQSLFHLIQKNTDQEKATLRISNINSYKEHYDILIRTSLGRIIRKIKVDASPFTTKDILLDQFLPSPAFNGSVEIISENKSSRLISKLSYTTLDMKGNILNHSQNIGDMPLYKEQFISYKSLTYPGGNTLSQTILIGNISPEKQTVNTQIFSQDGRILHTEAKTFEPFETNAIDVSRLGISDTHGVIKTEFEKKPGLVVSRYTGGAKNEMLLFSQTGRGFNEKDQTQIIAFNTYMYDKQHITLTNPSSLHAEVSVTIHSAQGKPFALPITIDPFNTITLELADYISKPTEGSLGFIMISGPTLADLIERKKGTSETANPQFRYSHSEALNSEPILFNEKNTHQQTKTAPLTQKQQHAEYRSYDIKLSDKDIVNLRAARDAFYSRNSTNTTPITVYYQGNAVRLELIPHEIRSKNFIQTSNSKSQFKNKNISISFFKLKAENKDFNARLTFIDDNKKPELRGKIQYNGYIYELKPHLMDLSKRTLTYTELKSTEDSTLKDLRCDHGQAPRGMLDIAHIPGAIIKKQYMTTKDSDYSQSNNTLVVEIATEADYEYYLLHGSSVEKANAYILDTINQSEAVYQNYFNISFKVVHQNVWTTPSTQYKDLTSIGRNREFKDYWEKNMRNKIHYDYAHFFTGVILNDYYPGRTFRDGMCSENAYSMTAIIDFAKEPYPPFDLYAFPHELGHNLGADHDNCSSCGYVMDGEKPGTKVFSEASQTVIKNNLPKYHCLSYLGKNTPPAFIPISEQSIRFGQTLELQIRATDAENDPITYRLHSAATYGSTFTNNVFRWTPNSNNVSEGSYIFSFKATDSKKAESIMHVVVKIVKNQAPTITRINDLTTEAGKSVLFSIQASDPEGDSITYSANSLPQGASLAGNQFTWKPEAKHIGTHSFTVFASDGMRSASQTVVIQVQQKKNSAPTFKPIGTQQILVQKMLSFTVDATDPDNDVLTYSASNLPKNATFTPHSKTFSWMPTTQDIGTRSVRFTVTDSAGLSHSLDVQIQVLSSIPLWQNPKDRFDVNNDNMKNAMDALRVINRLNARGSQILVGAPDFNKGDAYFDVNGDNSITAIDALNVINHLNSR